MMIEGIIEIINEFGVKKWGRMLLWIMRGMIYKEEGIVKLINKVMEEGVMKFIMEEELIG